MAVYAEFPVNEYNPIFALLHEANVLHLFQYYNYLKLLEMLVKGNQHVHIYVDK